MYILIVNIFYKIVFFKDIQIHTPTHILPYGKINYFIVTKYKVCT
jgi:hypothetical protein